MELAGEALQDLARFLKVCALQADIVFYDTHLFRQILTCRAATYDMWKYRAAPRGVPSPRLLLLLGWKI